MNETLMDQCLREAEEMFPSQPERLRELGYDDSAVWNACTEQAARRGVYATALFNERSKRQPMISVDQLAQAVRIEDRNHNLGAGALAEALMPYIRAAATNNTNDNGTDI